jgi:predicted RNase H-like nuclease (RuvC/YqgF family)
VFSENELTALHETIKSLAAERDALSRRLEQANATVHRLRIENDNLHKEVDRGNKARNAQ